jgi:hypothetical protein
MMRGIGYTKLVTGVLIAALVLGMAATRPLIAARSRSSGHTLDHDPAELAEALVNGEYAGQVALEGVFTGVFSDTLEPNEIDLGYIDLALALEQSGGEVSGHVVLTHTLVFTQEHTIDGGGIGPLVAGTFDGTTLQLTSEKFYRVMSGGRTRADGRILPERTATRQFSLISTEVVSPGARLVGEYRETIWGLTPLPVTVVGTFGLRPPAFAEPPRGQRSYLPLVLKNAP